MKKQSGFTLIELMVVMAIIAILATAGLSAYTGYIKKARDTTRIADVAAINSIILATLTSTGKPPQTGIDAYNAILNANNGKLIVDPLMTYPFTGTAGITDITAGNDIKKVCMNSAGTGDKACTYTYRLCDNGTGFAVGTRFESTSNKDLYSNDGITNGGTGTSYADNLIYEVGSCNTACTASSGACPSVLASPTQLTCTATTSLVCTAVTTVLDLTPNPTI